MLPLDHFQIHRRRCLRVMIVGEAFRWGAAIADRLAGRGHRIALLDAGRYSMACPSATSRAAELCVAATPGDRSLMLRILDDIRDRWGGIDRLVCGCQAGAAAGMTVQAVNVFCGDAMPMFRSADHRTPDGRILLAECDDGSSDTAFLHDLARTTRCLAKLVSGTGMTVNAVTRPPAPRLLSHRAGHGLLGDSGYDMARAGLVDPQAAITGRVVSLCMQSAGMANGRVFAA